MTMMSSWDRYRGFTFANIVSRVWALRNANPLKKLRLCRNQFAVFFLILLLQPQDFQVSRFCIFISSSEECKPRLFLQIPQLLPYPPRLVPTTLKRLQFCIHPQHFKINAPSLKYIYFAGHLSKAILLGNLSNLVEAVLETTDIDVTDIREYGNRVCVFIRAPYNVKSLHQDSRTTKVKHV